VPRIVGLGRITSKCCVLDVGCGTGGFAREIALVTGASVTGLDASAAFLEHARVSSQRSDSVTWVEADAQDMPFPPKTFDRVLLSLVLHQLARPWSAVQEAARVLRDGGVVLVRTIDPDDAVGRVPTRYLPSMAAADKGRMPTIASIVEWLATSGFVDITVTRHDRNAVLDLANEERAVRTEVEARYPMVSRVELEAGIDRMRADAVAVSGDWIDPRPTMVIVADRPAAMGARGSDARAPA
jgi:SAM-dependent methyltransferase